MNTMPANALSLNSVAPYPELSELAPKLTDHRTNPRHRRATDIVSISGNPTLAAYLSGLFQRSGWAIARARTVAEGISFVRTNLAGVAICDDVLPDGTWYDAAAALSSLPNPPVLIVIGDDPAIAHDVRALGGFDTLVRPLRESDVIWSVASAWHAWMKRAEGSSGSGGTRCPGA
jgi:hypothetical protein